MTDMTSSVCIFAGSSTGENRVFSTTAEDLGNLLQRQVLQLFMEEAHQVLGSFADSVIKITVK